MAPSLMRTDQVGSGVGCGRSDPGGGAFVASADPAADRRVGDPAGGAHIARAGKGVENRVGGGCDGEGRDARQ